MRTRLLSACIGITLFLLICFADLRIFTIAIVVLVAVAGSEFIGAYKEIEPRRSRGRGGLTGANPGLDAPLPPDSGGRSTTSPPRSGGRGASNWQTHNEMPQRTPESGGKGASLSLAPWLSPLLTRLAVLYPALFYGSVVAAQRLPAAQRPGWTVALPGALVVACCLLLLARALAGRRPLGFLLPAYGLLAHFYLGVLFGSLILLRGLPGENSRGAWTTLLVAVCVWATDSFAYLVGRKLGRRKLAPAVSPGKTVEGAVAGVLGALGVGAAFAAALHLPVTQGVALGAIAGILGQAGDLFESALKREIGIKDFGRIMPGHGGVLDRFDSLLFVAPIAYLYLRVVVG